MIKNKTEKVRNFRLKTLYEQIQKFIENNNYDITEYKNQGYNFVCDLCYGCYEVIYNDISHPILIILKHNKCYWRFINDNNEKIDLEVDSDGKNLIKMIEFVMCNINHELSSYDIWEKILDSGDLEEMGILLKKVIDNPKIVDLIIQKFSAAHEQVIKEMTIEEYLVKNIFKDKL